MKVSLPVIHRLPRYYRCLEELQQNGILTISSSQLSTLMGSTASQVRQDLNCFGYFGQQGVGYDVSILLNEIGQILFPKQNLKAALVGVGNLGEAIVRSMTKEKTGVDIVALFDNNQSIIGDYLCNIEIMDVSNLSAYCKENNIDILIICTPKDAAASLLDDIERSGVKGIWNFSHYDFSIRNDNWIIENVNLRDSFVALSYRINDINKKGD